MKAIPGLAISAVLMISVASAQSPQRIEAPGLSQAGQITFDAEGVPTVIGATDEDAAWLMGYAHASRRFFQMDSLRRIASGTLAELLGPDALAQDVQVRTLGLRRAAQRSWHQAGPELRAQLRAYANGVNAWLARNPLPLEYGALELSTASPWTAVDSLSIGKLLAYQLSFDLEIAQTLRLGAYQQAGEAAGFNGNALFFVDTHRSAPPDARASLPDFLTAPAALDAKAAAMQGVFDLPLFDPALLELARDYRDAIADNPVLAPQLKRRENRAGSNW